MRYAARLRLLAGSLLALTLFHVLWPTDAAQPDAAFDPKLLDAFVARPIGPANMGGRIVDIAAVDSDPRTMYVATASGGLWKTTNGGDTFTPVFDHQTSVCLGSVAVSQSHPDVVWVGTGEANARNSVAWGDGAYKSTDGGKTWHHMGLKDSHSIGRVVIHPKNPDIVYVAALGHLWGPNKERGIFKTTDGGRTWQVSKFIDESTGFVDLAMDPEEPDILYAAAYCVRRDAFSGGNPATQYGPGAGLYKTADGGKTWEKMTDGLPDRAYGRCGISIYRKDPKVVYAVVQTDKTPVTVAGAAANQKTGPEAGGIFRSDDKGKTWQHVNSLCPRPFYYGQIRIDPTSDSQIYVLGVQFHVSTDAGKTFATGGKGGAHPDHHALWINPNDSSHLVLGNDGGLYFSKTKGKSWEAIRRMAIGQFYGISVDMRKPYRVYGGLQDNGSWGGPSATYNEGGIHLNDWFRIGGGDGFYTACDPDDADTVYCESQYGKPSRVNVKNAGKGGGGKGGGGGKSIAVKGQGNRWNWSSPLVLSPHDSKTILYGGNFLFKSTDRGDNWKQISPDLTAGPPGKSASTGHTLSTLSESPKKAGIIWTGSDDGRVHVTRDGGDTWTDVSDKVPGVPKNRWISRVEASYHDEGTCYLAITRYRNDDRKPYVFKTTDFGETWTNITSDLPAGGAVHVIRESSRNKDLLFVGTEFGLFTSLDGGRHWHRLKGGLPTVAVHDLVIHPRDRDLVIGTHGRSIYVMDIGPLEEMTPGILAREAQVFATRPSVAFKWQKPADTETKSYIAPNPPYGAVIHYYLKKDPAKAVSLVILDATGRQVANLSGASKAGLHKVVWNLRADGEKETVRPGEYMVLLQLGEEKALRKIRVEAE
jgi:photosystem II stability/assembly factor-like uncharacterized protein